jgi:hypothetical protein
MSVEESVRFPKAGLSIKRTKSLIDNIEQMAQPSEGHNKLIRQGITAGFKQ